MSSFVKGGGGGSEKVTIDGVKVKAKLELTSYKGANPLTIGQAGVAFPANTLLETALQIVNGVQAGIPMPSGYSKFTTSTFTRSSDTEISYYGIGTISHNLGVKPKAIVIIGEPNSNSQNNAISRIIIDAVSSNSYAVVGMARLKNGYNHPTGNLYSIDANTFAIYINSGTYYFTKGVTYTMVAMA